MVLLAIKSIQEKPAGLPEASKKIRNNSNMGLGEPRIIPSFYILFNIIKKNNRTKNKKT